MKRHHAAHPPTAVKPNDVVNKKPEAYQKPAKRVSLPAKKLN